MGRRREPGGSSVLDDSAHISVGDLTELSFLEAPVSSCELLELGGPRAHFLAQAAAVGAELEV